MRDLRQNLDRRLAHAPNVVGRESARDETLALLDVERVHLGEEAVRGNGLRDAGDVHDGGLAHAENGVVGERRDLVDEELLAELSAHERRQLVHELERRRAVVFLLRVVRELCGVSARAYRR